MANFNIKSIWLVSSQLRMPLIGWDCWTVFNCKRNVIFSNIAEAFNLTGRVCTAIENVFYLFSWIYPIHPSPNYVTILIYMYIWQNGQLHYITLLAQLDHILGGSQTFWDLLIKDWFQWYVWYNHLALHHTSWDFCNSKFDKIYLFIIV